MTMTIKTNTFAESCYNMNSINELENALTQGPDEADMEEWNLTAEEWREQVELALTEKRTDKECAGAFG